MPATHQRYSRSVPYRSSPGPSSHGKFPLTTMLCHRLPFCPKLHRKRVRARLRLEDAIHTIIIIDLDHNDAPWVSDQLDRPQFEASSVLAAILCPFARVANPDPASRSTEDQGSSINPRRLRLRHGAGWGSTEGKRFPRSTHGQMHGAENIRLSNG
jgi:hypothetical protein